MKKANKAAEPSKAKPPTQKVRGQVNPILDMLKNMDEDVVDMLRQSIENGGQPILTTEMELAPDLVRAMDLYRAGKNKHQRSLKRFVEDLRTGIRSLR